MISNYIFIIIITALLLLLAVVVILFKNKINNIRKKSDENLKLIINTVNSVRYGNLAARLIINDGNNFPVLSESINRMVETIQDREKMIQEFKKEITGQNVFLETLINSLSEGFLILNDDLIIQKMTSESVKLLGEDAEGSDFKAFVELPVDIDLSKRCSFEAPLKKQHDIILMVTISILNFSGNDDFKYLATIKDISKENELRQVKSDFITTLAHDLRVPLLAECNTLKLLKNGKFGELNDKISEVTELLMQSNKDVLLLTDVLLETYKLEQADLVLNKHNTNVNSLIKEVCDEMFGVAAANSMVINLNFCDDFDCQLDEFQIKRVLRNIINNSVDYSSQVADKIDIYSKNDNHGCYITIRDYGNGISEEEQEHIFQKFYSGAHKFRKVGSGLGLYLANEIVKAHGGKISIVSIPGKNTDFEIFIPI